MRLRRTDYGDKVNDVSDNIFHRCNRSFIAVIKYRSDCFFHSAGFDTFCTNIVVGFFTVKNNSDFLKVRLKLSVAFFV